MKIIIFGILLVLVTIMTAATPITVFAANDDNGFTLGYNNGVMQGTIGRQAHVFHIGTVCIGQTDSWCAGYTDGYLDGFFQNGIPTTSSHTTITIRGGGDHDHHHCEGNCTGGCGHVDMSCKCPKGDILCVHGPGGGSGSNGGSTGGSIGGSTGGSTGGGTSGGSTGGSTGGSNGGTSGGSTGGSSSGGSSSGGSSSGSSSGGSSSKGSSSGSSSSEGSSGGSLQ